MADKKTKRSEVLTKRLNLELTLREHKELKRNALREDKTIRAYVRERLFSMSGVINYHIINIDKEELEASLRDEG